jgi:hypothetical protein
MGLGNFRLSLVMRSICLLFLFLAVRSQVFCQTKTRLETIKVKQCVQPIALADSLTYQPAQITEWHVPHMTGAQYRVVEPILKKLEETPILLNGAEVVRAMEEICTKCQAHTVRFCVEKVIWNKAKVRIEID